MCFGCDLDMAEGTDPAVACAVNVTGILPNGQEYEPYTFYYTPDSASAPMSCNLNAYGLPRLQRLGAVRFESAAGFLTGTAETLFDRIFTTKYY
ncbi:hypothetical protein LTS18_005967 [Coniosporium uncinatum]|uniref:Uncharacterized protein n=2 Tax=Coniosporium uncinatum TaxID=93489 RepID=A0ACC3D4I5_9PEZI|nr:hypothetical protein LTS18_005967 [Coniosporium uncinatum]